jgi:hypothetical protein
MRRLPPTPYNVGMWLGLRALGIETTSPFPPPPRLTRADVRRAEESTPVPDRGRDPSSPIAMGPAQITLGAGDDS